MSTFSARSFACDWHLLSARVTFAAGAPIGEPLPDSLLLMRLVLDPLLPSSKSGECVAQTGLGDNGRLQTNLLIIGCHLRNLVSDTPFEVVHCLICAASGNLPHDLIQHAFLPLAGNPNGFAIALTECVICHPAAQTLGGRVNTNTTQTRLLFLLLSLRLAPFGHNPSGHTTIA